MVEEVCHENVLSLAFGMPIRVPIPLSFYRLPRWEYKLSASTLVHFLPAVVFTAMKIDNPSTIFKTSMKCFLYMLTGPWYFIRIIKISLVHQFIYYIWKGWLKVSAMVCAGSLNNTIHQLYIHQCMTQHY